MFTISSRQIKTLKALSSRNLCDLIPIVSCVLLVMLLIAATNPLLACWNVHFYPWNLQLHGRVRAVKITVSGPMSTCVFCSPFALGKNGSVQYLRLMFINISHHSVSGEK